MGSAGGLDFAHIVYTMHNNIKHTTSQNLSNCNQM